MFTYIHGRSSCGGQNLGQTQAELTNLIDHQWGAAKSGQPFSCLLGYYDRGISPTLWGSSANPLFQFKGNKGILIVRFYRFFKNLLFPKNA